MKVPHWLEICLEICILTAGIGCIPALAQAPAEPQGPATQPAAAPTGTEAEPVAVVLEWTPPALALLSTQAEAKSSFTLDRTMLNAASSLLPDSEKETRQAVAKIDGVSVHMLRFSATGIADQTQVEAVREAYHQRGWKHLVTTTDVGGPVHNGFTDVWLVMNGTNVRGAVVLVSTPTSLTLATLKGDLSPVDLLHLRGHFGIPRFDGDSLKDAKDK
jgi:hypothetical protein